MSNTFLSPKQLILESSKTEYQIKGTTLSVIMS